MFSLRRLSFIAVIFAAALSVAGDKSSDKLEGWLPVTEQDKQLKDVPGNPGAPAIQLYYSYYRDDNDEFITIYRRIKILREAGLKYADAEIIMQPGNSLKEIAARTIHPDGSIVDYQGKPYDKTLFKARGFSYRAKVITLPQVTVGSIVEYKSKVTWLSRFVTPSRWIMQGDLYTVRARFRFRAYQDVLRVASEWNPTTNIRRSRVSYTYRNQVDERVPDKKSENLMELELESIPAFEAEEYMPPEDDYKPQAIFYYGGEEIASPDKFWDYVGKLWPKAADGFIGDYREVRNFAAQVTGNEADPEKKLRALYAAAQKIRNLSSERERGEEESKQEGLRPNKDVIEVLTHRYGTQSDITRLFVALARAAGYEAWVIQVADRSRTSFEKLVLSTAQISSSAALVKVNGKDIVFWPGVKYCPYGLVPWNHSSVTALKLNKSGAEFITTPGPQNSVMHRMAKVALASDGSLKGEITAEFSGQDALQHRLDSLETDDAGRRKGLEDQVQAWLPPNAIVKLQNVTGWDDSEASLLAHFTIEIPAFASVAGKRLIAPAFFFPTLQKNMFIHEGRRYPIVFSYPFTEIDEVTIKLPEGYSLEVPPYRRKAGLSYAGYEISSSLQGDQLITKRALHFDSVYFEPEEYPGLKGFFNIVQAGDNGQAVLQPQPIANAQQ